MRLYEFVDSSRDNNDNWNSRFSKAWSEGLQCMVPVFSGYKGANVTINNEFSSYEEWSDAGKPSITSIGDSSRTEKYYIGFVDYRAIKRLSKIDLENVSSHPHSMFKLDFYDTFIYGYGILDFTMDEDFHVENSKIYSDVIELCVDEYINCFDKQGIRVLKIKG